MPSAMAATAYNYYLRIGPPQADFVLRMTPSSLNVPAGGTGAFTVYAFRKDGWDGDIERDAERRARPASR